MRSWRVVGVRALFMAVCAPLQGNCRAQYCQAHRQASRIAQRTTRQVDQSEDESERLHRLQRRVPRPADLQGKVRALGLARSRRSGCDSSYSICRGGKSTRVRHRFYSMTRVNQAVEKGQVVESDAVVFGEAADRLEGRAAHQRAGVADHVAKAAPGPCGPEKTYRWAVGPGVGTRIAVTGETYTRCGYAVRAGEARGTHQSRDCVGNRTLSSSRKSSQSPRAAAAAVLRAAPR